MSRFKHVVYWYIDANQQLRREKNFLTFGFELFNCG